MNETATVEQREEPFSIPRDVLIELIKILVTFQTQLEENRKPEEDTECISDTIALVCSVWVQNLVDHLG